MKTTILTSIILITSVTISFGCCAEKIYRILPLGELNNEVVFVEFDLFRDCNLTKDADGNIEFWISGKVNIVTTQSDRLVPLTQIDTINTKECDCNYKNFYELTEIESVLEQNYRQALKQMKKNSGFKIARTEEITFNDTTNTTRREIATDSTNSVIINYRDLISIELEFDEIISCYPDKVTEVRKYKTENYDITILRLRCNQLKDLAMGHNRERFKNIETAIWKESAQWHGIAKDYSIVKKNNR